MATSPLPPGAAPANAGRAPFDLALTRYAAAVAARDALPPSASIAADMAAGEAVERAEADLAACTAPDLSAFATKLRVALTGSPIAAALLADVRQLAGRAAGAATWTS